MWGALFSHCPHKSHTFSTKNQLDKSTRDWRHSTKHGHGHDDTRRHDMTVSQQFLKIKDMGTRGYGDKKILYIYFSSKIFIVNVNNYIFYSNISKFSNSSIAICYNYVNKEFLKLK